MLNRKIKPELKGNVDFKIPEISQFSLPNSLKVFFSLKNTLPIVNIMAIIPSGSIYNGSRHGLSKLTSMLIDEGAGKLTGLQISDELEILGSIMNINSGREFTTVSILTLKENLEKSLEIFSKILRFPNFNESDFNREKSRLKSQIMTLNDNPSYIASVEILKKIYAGTEYEHSPNGFTNSISDLSNEEVNEFYKKRYFPNNSSVIVVGDLNRNLCEKLMHKYFGDWGNPTSVEEKNIRKFANLDKNFVLLNKNESAQSEIRIGHTSKSRKSKDFYARTVLNSILGGQFSSRINLNLREDKGYTYGAQSNYNYNRKGSAFIVSTSVKTEDTADAIIEILTELDQIKKNITNEELEFSKSFLIRRYPSLFETYSQTTNNISLLPMYDLNIDFHQNYIERIQSVQLEDVQRAAIENIELDNIQVVVVGNMKSINQELVKAANIHNFSIVSQDVLPD